MGEMEVRKSHSPRATWLSLLSISDLEEEIGVTLEVSPA